MRRLRIGDPPNQRSLRVRDEGESTSSKRPALVCVHGVGSSSVIFMDVVRRLSPQRRVVAPDLPGHGQSDPWDPAPEVSIEMYRDAVGTVCAQLQLERAVLLGHSMGALVALAAAAAWPERVAGLVLINAGAHIKVAPEVFTHVRSDFARFGKWFSRLVWSPATPIDVIERWGAVALTADQTTTEADFAAVARFDGTPLLAKIKTPTLVLSGADDLSTPPKLGQALAAGIAGARSIVVPEAGHMLIQEQPETFYAELETFLIASVS
jgi:pimeloyl-ACP methyl ester carboxylesterase